MGCRNEGVSTNEWIHRVDICEILKEILRGLVRIRDVE